MLFTSALLGLLYVVFGVVLLTYLNVGIAPMLVIVVGLAFFQYYTCLLYTSPSPRDRQKSRMPSSA